MARAIVTLYRKELPSILFTLENENKDIFYDCVTNEKLYRVMKSQIKTTGKFKHCAGWLNDVFALKCKRD